MSSCDMSTQSFRRSTPLRFIALLLALLAVYVLSSGPVHALYSSHRIQGPIPKDLVAFYVPVNWLYAHTPIGKPMTAHDAWWKEKLRRS